MSVVTFHSLTDFLAAVPVKTTGRAVTNSDFTGYQTQAQARVNLFNGSKTGHVIDASSALMDKLDADGIASPGLQWRHAVAGAIPCVPSYLANAPEAMRAPHRVSSNSAPVRIFASVCYSAETSETAIANRGTAILALARKLASMRPVELYVFAEMHGRDKGDGTGNCAIPVIRLDTSPLDLTSASYAMGNPGFLRQLCFTWCDGYGFNGHWAWQMSPGAASLEKTRKVLQCNPEDLVIQGTVRIYDAEAWVAENLARFTDCA